MTSEAPVGRQSELAKIRAFLEGVSGGGAGALAITGMAGIGKTTVWREGIARARARDLTVLVARPTAPETRLSYSGLVDLLRPISDTALEELPPIQQEALGAALLRGKSAPGHGARVVATALLSLLSDIAADRGVVIAVEDAQWLDAATAEALSFAIRRLDEQPIGVLASVRTDGARPHTFELALPPERRRDLELGPMSTAAIHDVIERQLELSFPRPVVVQIATVSGGNPLYAIEIARELERTGLPQPGRTIQPPGQLRSLVAARIARLPGATRDALLVAASLSKPTVEFVSADSLAPAADDGIVVVEDGGAIAFTHPLLAAAVYESASKARRRDVHLDLADRVSDAEERARHLGLAADAPDERIAAELDRAAAHAAARGAPVAASELARRALELGAAPRSTAGAQRALALSRHLIDLGQTGEAKVLLERTLDFELDGDLRARVLARLGELSWYERDFIGGYARLVEALEFARDPMLIARIHNQAAWIAVDEPHGVAQAIAHEDAALQTVAPGPGPYASALMYRAYLRLINGDGADEEAINRGMAMGPPQDRDDESPVPIVWPMFMDDFELARERLHDAIAAANSIGDEPSLQTLLAHLAAIECWTGNWTLADEYAERAVDVSERIASSTYLGSALFARGYVDAHLGRLDQAHAAGVRILALFADEAEPQRLFGHWLQGLSAFMGQDFEQAAVQLGIAAVMVDRMGQREPVRSRFHPDQAEAVIAMGDLARAELLIARLDERAQVFPRPWLLATTERCRGLLYAARGDLDSALTSIDLALAHHADLDMPFERARTLLAKGQLLRRNREKREARHVIGEARAEFARLGAPHWVERAERELARIPTRRSSESLSATETQIAQLAAEGLTNREIAERAFVSPKTVEANMARIYRKLDIRSRAQLGRAIADREHAAET